MPATIVAVAALGVWAEIACDSPRHEGVHPVVGRTRLRVLISGFPIPPPRRPPRPRNGTRSRTARARLPADDVDVVRRSASLGAGPRAKAARRLRTRVERGEPRGEPSARSVKFRHQFTIHLDCADRRLSVFLLLNYNLNRTSSLVHKGLVA